MIEVRKLLASIEQSLTSRVVVAVVVIIIPAFIAWIAFGLTPQQRTILAAKTVMTVGTYLPALLIGGVAGWLFYSKQVWMWSTLGLTLATLLLDVSFNPRWQQAAHQPSTHQLSSYKRFDNGWDYPDGPHYSYEPRINKRAPRKIPLAKPARI